MNTSTADIDAAAQAWVTAARAAKLEHMPIKTCSYPDPYKEKLQERRKTLQIISGFSSQNQGPRSTSKLGNGTSNQTALPTAEELRLKRLRHRNLSVTGIQTRIMPQPLIVLTPADIPESALVRSFSHTSSAKSQRAHTLNSAPSATASNSARRRSLNARIRRQSSPLTTVKECEQIEIPKPSPLPVRPRSISNYSNLGNVDQRNYDFGKGSNNDTALQSSEDEWNALRERELVNREQAANASRLSREQEREGSSQLRTGVGIPSTVPSVSPSLAADIQKIPVSRDGSSGGISSAPFAKLPRNTQRRSRVESMNDEDGDAIIKRVSEAHRSVKDGNAKARMIDGQSMSGLSRGGSVSSTSSGGRAIHRSSFHNTAIDPSWSRSNDISARYEFSRSRPLSIPTPHHDQYHAISQPPTTTALKRATFGSSTSESKNRGSELDLVSHAPPDIPRTSSSIESPRPVRIRPKSLPNSGYLRRSHGITENPTLNSNKHLQQFPAITEIHTQQSPFPTVPKPLRPHRSLRQSTLSQSSQSSQSSLPPPILKSPYNNQYQHSAPSSNRASISSQYTTKSLLTTGATTPQSYQTHIPSHFLSIDSSKTSLSPTNNSTTALPPIVYRENPDKRHLNAQYPRIPTPVEMEKIALWRAENGGDDMKDERQTRERVKERVRRANELEKERERELQDKQAKKKGKKATLERLFCGVFRI